MFGVPDDVVERTARHEAAHAAAGLLFHWIVGPARIGGDTGSCQLERPSGRSRIELDEEDGVVTMCGALSVGWLAWPNDSSDRSAVFDLLSSKTSDPYDLQARWNALEHRARQLMSTLRFQQLAGDLEKALLRRQYLSQEDIHDVALLGFDGAARGWAAAGMQPDAELRAIIERRRSEPRSPTDGSAGIRATHLEAGQVWISDAVAASLLGVRQQEVGRMVANDVLPSVAWGSPQGMTVLGTKRRDVQELIEARR